MNNTCLKRVADLPRTTNPVLTIPCHHTTIGLDSKLPSLKHLKRVSDSDITLVLPLPARRSRQNANLIFVAKSKGSRRNNFTFCCRPPGPLARRERRAIPGAVCEERATKPAGLRAAALRGAAAKGAYRLCCRSSTMSDIDCVAAPRICPPGARAKCEVISARALRLPGPLSRLK